MIKEEKLKKIHEKMSTHNAIVKKLESAGFIYCDGVILTNDSYNWETGSFHPNSRRIGKLVWENERWVIKPYSGYEHLFEGDFE